MDKGEGAVGGTTYGVGEERRGVCESSGVLIFRCFDGGFSYE